MKDGWLYDIFGTITTYTHIGKIDASETRQIHLTAFDKIHVSVIHETIRAICDEFGFTYNIINSKRAIIIDDESKEGDA